MSLHFYVNNQSLTSLGQTEKVLILTVDGRTLIGDLLSTDQTTNLVLANTVERIIRTPDDDEPSTEIEHGLYLIRGDNVVVCGEIDEKMDGDIDWSKVKGEVIRDTKNA
ncbi:U6 snrna-associated sm-like protein [Penicillium coprophilum]|uniref:U6 snrna-associated sm-like protein n=1 Tax=Penicillium coprophilum TaxID=36646 RepID=UPI002382DBD5|nr:U6 snrna-associated sm-like protein [Penicillium coprophilum]KAJ5158389.1 U6 snrna-associated sm-like protein [Penicillium coprophilum]